MALPDRFSDATFERYDPKTSSQTAAYHAVHRFVETAQTSPSWMDRIKQVVGGGDSSRKDGLYLVGPSGTGKTHLLAAAYHALAPEVSCAFLHSSTLFRSTEPPAAFAHQLADAHAVCCLDEVEIDDPANEMRLVQVMKTLAARDVQLLATSNVEPEAHLSRQMHGSRFQRFLQQEFRDRYRVVVVRGADHRRTDAVQRTGAGWIGPPPSTRSAMQEARAATEGPDLWWTFPELRRATTETAHPTLIDELTAVDHFFIEDIVLRNTDDALRLLRIVDALHLHEDAPALYFTAERPPDVWFDPDEHAGVAKAVAEKFDRTVSRLYALCQVHRLDVSEAA